MRVERIDPLIQDERGLLLADGHHPLQLDRLAPDRDALQRLAFTAQLIDEDGLRGPFLSGASGLAPITRGGSAPSVFSMLWAIRSHRYAHTWSTLSRPGFFQRHHPFGVNRSAPVAKAG